MRFLLIPADILDAAYVLTSTLPMNRPLTSTEEQMLSHTLIKCVVTARVLVTYATWLSGKPRPN